MEVHPPEHPIHTWRDFLIHIATIVVGLLIAIGLEQSVEWLHHRHVVHIARENIRQELKNNHTAATDNLASLDQNIVRIQTNIKTIHAMMDHPKGFKGSLINHMDTSSLSDSAFRSARDTGALSYMPYEDVQRIADLYSTQDLVTQQTISTFQHEFMALAPTNMGYDIDQLPPAQYQAMLHDNAATLIELTTLKQLTQQLDTEYQKELKRQ